MTLNRTPRSARRALSERRYARNSRISAPTSRGGRLQLSELKAKRVRVWTPSAGAASTTCRTASAPWRCPAERGRPRAEAHRPLPSMMIATWSAFERCVTELLKELGGIKCLVKKKVVSAVHAEPCDIDDRFHVIEIALQRAPAGRGEPILRMRPARLEALAARDVLGLLELARVHAQIAIGRVQHGLELIERHGLVGRERTHDAQAHPVVNERIELHEPRGMTPVMRRL